MTAGDIRIGTESGFESSYATLPESFFARVAPTPVSQPSLLRLNLELARDLGLSAEALASPEGIEILAGNRPLGEVDPIAMAYAGHQFGNWVPSLGDGRAIQIGEVVDLAGAPHSIQLKGAGPTPFSRRGDGRASVGPVVREYVLSEAMHALGIPTTRALAMVMTGEQVFRERPEPGAILTRVATGYVRVGTFEYFSARRDTEAIRSLADYVVARRYPDAADSPNPYRTLLDRVIEGQADLIARWLHVGFIHGVMNTDNMSIMGETIDYGPCAFLDEYTPTKVFSSIDRNGRYAYDQQPGVGLWNLTRFAETLLPLLAHEDLAHEDLADGELANEEEGPAVESAKEALERYSGHFHRLYDEGLIRKLGLVETGSANREVASGLLETMAAQGADFTLTFRRLSELRLDDATGDSAARALFAAPEAFDVWADRWRGRLRAEGRDDAIRNAEMRGVNPLFIPRNHRVQQAIDAVVAHQDPGPLEALLAVTRRPFEDDPERADYASPPEPHEAVRQTFCGT